MKPHTYSHARAGRWFAALALVIAGSAFAQAADPPGRVAALTHMEGSVVFAPAGRTEWSEAARNRPITRGDRLWTDEGARAELHMGSAALQMDSRTFVDVVALDEEVLQVSLNEGVVNARVRQVQGGENFEIDTPHLALRATQPGDFRVDVEPQQGFTRVTVHSGMATLYGAGGGVLQLQAGQSMAFAGRELAQVAGSPANAQDTFDRWAADRNRIEDQSIAARHVPRAVVGYQQLDANGTWSQDATYGQVWYPQVTVADWAPYRYGRWEWINPWGWTWVDDAPWGFATSHYGRWAEIGSRWAWVPGSMGPRPMYAPALVAFMGGGSSLSLSIGSGPGIGWYPLAPGEAWQPFYAASPLYVRNVNRYIVTDSRYAGRPHYFQRRPDAVTTVRVDDFQRGRPVHDRWSRANFADLSRAQTIAPPRAHDTNRWMAERSSPLGLRTQPPSYGAQQAAIVARPQQVERRDEDLWRRRAQEEQQRGQQVQQERGQREQAQREQGQRQWQQERAQRDQQQQAARQAQVQQHQAMQQQLAQRDQAMRQQQGHDIQQRQLAWQAQQQQQRAEMGYGPQRGAPQQAAPAQQPQHEARGPRGQRGQRDERAQGGDDDNGRSHGRGNRNN